MPIQERVSGGVTILDIEGRLTIETVADLGLADMVRRLLQAGRKQIVLNLERVPRVDTTGLCAIVEAYVAAKRQDGLVKLLHLTPHVQEVLKVTRLLTVFEAYDDEVEATASFGVAVT